LIISLIKQTLTLAVALSKVLSKFLMSILHLSIQAFDRSIIHLALTGTNPDFPCASFSTFEGFFESSNLMLQLPCPSNHYARATVEAEPLDLRYQAEPGNE
jgi:hypothetical protein